MKSGWSVGGDKGLNKVHTSFFFRSAALLFSSHLYLVWAQFCCH